jgi:hypothetical protein
MIQINLLPPERRRTERTPIGRFVLILFGVILFCAVSFFIVYLEINIRGLQRQLADRQTDYNSPKTAQINLEYADLTARDATHKSRKAVISQLRPAFRWSNVLDLLCDMLETRHKKIWFDTIRTISSKDVRSMQQKLGPKMQIDGGLIVEGQSAGLDPAPLLKFRHDVVQKPEKEKAQADPETSGGKPAQDGKPAGAKAPPAGTQTPPAGTPAVPGKTAAGDVTPVVAKRGGKVLIDYFTGGILKVVEFAAKNQDDYEEMFSQSFTIEFYVRKAAAGPKKKK